MKEQTRKKKKRKLKNWTKVAIVIISILLVAVVLVGAAYGVYRNYYNKMNYEETTVRTELGRGMRRILEGDTGTLMWAEHVYNVLLIGQDSRNPDEIRRSDTMILVSINEHTEEIIMTSIMRDSWVYIPGYGAERINEAYYQGGADLLIETIEMNFDVRIDNYVSVDFFSFIEIVDALGGVEIEISEEELPVLNDPYIYYMNHLLGHPEGQDYVEHSGLNNLNGVQALCYARIRYLEGADFARTERQRKVLNSIFEKFKDCTFTELVDVLNVVLPNITTDISEETMLSLLMNVTTQYKDYELVQYRVPYADTYEGWSNDVAGTVKEVLSIDIEANSQYMIRDIYGVTISEEE